MSDSKDGPRDLTKNWCAEGASFDEAVVQLHPDTWIERVSAFGGTEDFEARAALYLHVFTGDLPRLEDTDGRQGAVDLTLHNRDRLTGIVEVTSTLDQAYQRNSSNLELMIDDLNVMYRGSRRWAINFGHGWSLPAGKHRVAFARELALALEALPDGDQLHDLEVSPMVRAYRISESGEPAVNLAGWSANIPDGWDTPYLNRLSSYLSTSDLVARKLKKLSVEGDRLSAELRHLYLLMASTGNEGGLLPISPSYLTWGDFSPPEILTNLWLDGGTGEIYQWDAAEGWRYHKL
jgi:hypothetical protein